MSTSKETGHQVNIDNLDLMIVILKGFGAKYNPSNPDIGILELEKRLSDSRSAQSVLHEVKQPYTSAVNTRKEAFEPLEPLVTRVLNSLVATKTSAQTDQSAKALVHKMKGEKVSKKKTTEAAPNQTTLQPEDTQISSAQLGYDDQLHNMDEFIKLLEITPQYNPNEIDLKIESLKTYRDDLATKNHTVIETKVAVDNARITRNEALYKPLTGLVDTAADVKTYVKSVFGATSPQFRQISGLKFSPLKK
ncbi:MAG: hypothetical protein WCK78_15740 [Paludibacter sp.]